MDLPFEIAVSLDGRPAGTLSLGKTTLEEAAALLPPPPPGWEGGPRPADLQLQIGDLTLAPTTVFNPDGTMYILFFEERDILVLLVDGSVFDGERDVQDVMEEYPGLQETQDEPNWTEMQAPLTECATLVAVFTASGKLDSLGYAYTCAP